MKWKELAIRDKSTACLYFVCIICTNAKRIKDIAMHCLNALALNCQKTGNVAINTKEKL